MIRLDLLEPAWIDDAVGNPADPCAHGRIRLSIGGTTLVDPADGEYTVSAAALHLLRTIGEDSTPSSSVAEGCQLVPCCAHALFPSPTARFGFVAIGCPSGIELDVEHGDGTVRVRRRDTGQEAELTGGEWERAVLGFAAQVRGFYARSAPKDPPADTDERAAWSLFWSEWEERTRSGRSGR